ncbi:Gfo/Idh/MocA family protein [Alkalihalobacillus sp. TS-13]|uniref:Gfo/Idh/MocA family protein n=1 Tax=Alkalihalobacillus sp. TS-13 TaxID=2842455 RepID=UPI001C86A0E7|nr:Gfo/Idh/MocA family oxidoreductase [Alkalihalobacillus sp. TS-13]
MNLTVGVIGAGIIAVDHFKAIEQMEGLRTVAVVDVNEQKVNLFSKCYGILGYTDYREMILLEKPDIIIVTLPHYLHKEAAIFAAEQGCHILLEKPMALDTAECNKILQAVESNNVMLMVGHIQHYFAENMMARKILRQKRLGKLIMVNENRHMDYFTSDRPGWFLQSEKSGGGIVMNLGAHCIDKIQWILETRFKKGIAKLSYDTNELEVESDVEGSGILYLETIDGVPVTISLAGYKVVPKHVTELIFTNGMMKVEVGKGLWINQTGTYEEVPCETEVSPFISQLQELVDAIYGRSEITNTGTYAKSIIQVIEGCYRSHREGKVIDFPEVSE